MTELDSDIASTEHRLWMARKGVNHWEIPALEKRLASLKADRDHVNAITESVMRSKEPWIPVRIEVEWYPDYAFTPTGMDESFHDAQERANRERGL